MGAGSFRASWLSAICDRGPCPPIPRAVSPPTCTHEHWQRTCSVQLESPHTGPRLPRLLRSPVRRFVIWSASGGWKLGPATATARIIRLNAWTPPASATQDRHRWPQSTVRRQEAGSTGWLAR
eukprot:718358-Rhodomonas_salina.2